MKRAYAAALCLCLLLVGCAPSDGQMTEQTTAETQSHETQSTASDAAVQQQTPRPGDPALYFSGELPDPQSMAPTYEAGTLTFEGTFTPLAGGGYETALHLTRSFPQGVNPTTGEAQPEGYVKLCYDSMGHVTASELPAKAKAALEEKSAADVGQRQYGLLPMHLRSEANTMQTTGSFYLPTDYKKQYSTEIKLPYLLTTNGDSASLYLQFNSLATVKLEGALTVPPDPTPHQAVEMRMLYFNDEGRTPEQNKQKDVWNILFLGEQSDSRYGGTLYLWHWREQTGSAPSNLCYIPGEASAYEQPVNLEFEPFDEARYLAAGGKQNARQRAVLTGMTAADCGGKQVLFTVCGETVYAELPGASVGILEGRFTEEADMKRIHEESLTLYKRAHNYHLSPLSPMTEDMIYSAQQGGQTALSTEHAKMTWGAPDGVPGFLPAEFVSMLRPVDFMEKRPATLIFGNFQYLEDGYWLDTIGPLYRRQLAGMQNLQTMEGETGEGTGYEMEIAFRYGERTVGCYLANTPTGTSVSIIIYG